MILFMFGPAITARSIEGHRAVDAYGNPWQYNPWSDHHSKVACWAALFDLLLSCDLLRRHAAAKDVGFGINHRMGDFRMDRQKDLDLVVCTPGSQPDSDSRTFASLADVYGIVLSETERSALRALPALIETSVGSVHLALEAKATMTAHIKALPRLYDELTSSHLCVHGNSNRAIAAGLSIINSSREFVSPKNNPWSLKNKKKLRVNEHQQPKDTARTIAKVRQIPRRSNVDERGFDALAIVVVDMRNDGSAVRLITEEPAPPQDDILHYDSMIRRVAQLYEARFPHV